MSDDAIPAKIVPLGVTNEMIRAGLRVINSGSTDPTNVYLAMVAAAPNGGDYDAGFDTQEIAAKLFREMHQGVRGVRSFANQPSNVQAYWRQAVLVVARALIRPKAERTTEPYWGGFGPG